MSKERPIPAPVPNPETSAFWDAAAAGRFMLPKCRSCGRSHWYPRRICPHCSSFEIELIDARGTGAVYSYSIMARASEPYVIAYVRLDEGPIMMTNIVDCPHDAVHVGMPVKLVLRASAGGPPVPMFTKA